MRSFFYCGRRGFPQSQRSFLLELHLGCTSIFNFLLLLPVLTSYKSFRWISNVLMLIAFDQHFDIINLIIKNMYQQPFSVYPVFTQTSAHLRGLTQRTCSGISPTLRFNSIVNILSVVSFQERSSRHDGIALYIW